VARKKGSIWLYGCGLGCAIVGIAVAAMLGAGMLYFKRIGTGFDKAISARRELDQRHGTPEAFVPWPDGSIPADRLERFLRVRQSLGPSREALTSAFARLPITPEQSAEFKNAHGLAKVLKALTVGKDAMGLAPAIAQFFGARDQGLLDSEMGMGEYTYLYTVAYHAWLGHPSDDGPGGEWSEKGEQTHGNGMRSPRTDLRVRDELTQMLRNQQRALSEGGDPAWRAALAAEIAALEKPGGHDLWKDGVPPPTAASLEPYRAKLESTYSAATNPFELARTSRRGRFSFEAD